MVKPQDQILSHKMLDIGLGVPLGQLVDPQLKLAGMIRQVVGRVQWNRKYLIAAVNIKLKIIRIKRYFIQIRIGIYPPFFT